MAFAHHFGAVGDGLVDDTKALEHALDAGEGVLELGKGTFRITRPIVLDTTRIGYTAVRGQAGTSRIVMDGPGPALKLVGDHRGTAQPQSYQDHTWEKERFPTISGLEILGQHVLEHPHGLHPAREAAQVHAQHRVFELVPDTHRGVA